MTILEQQFKDLAEKFPGAKYEQLAGGSHVIIVPDFHLPDGWTQRSTTVRFIVPFNYPHARPDCFWTDNNLQIAGGRPPQNTGINGTLPGPYLWYSWHVQNWSPNSDTLLTYLRVIENRFRQRQ